MAAKDKNDQKPASYTVEATEYYSLRPGGTPSFEGNEPKDHQPYTRKVDHKITVEELLENTATRDEHSLDKAKKLMKIMDKNGDGYLDASDIGRGIAAIQKLHPKDFQKIVADGHIKLSELTKTILDDKITREDLGNIKASHVPNVTVRSKGHQVE